MNSIITVPHSTLRKKSRDIESVHGAAIQAQILELVDTLKSAREPEGVGLSFPQINLSLRGFVTYLDHKIRVYLNPVVVDRDDTLTLGGLTDRPTLEGCLSIPHLYGPVYRPRKIKIRATDEHGVEFAKTLTSFSARVFLHELDHLDAVLFTDYTLKGNLPLFFLDTDRNEFVEVKDPRAVIKW